MLVVEGEKKSDAAAGLGMLAVASASGSLAAAKTDWSPLAGKAVWILCDNNAPGRRFGLDVAGIVTQLTPPAVVKFVDLPDLPEGKDLADWIELQGDAAEPAALKAALEQLGPRPRSGPGGCPVLDAWPPVKPIPSGLLPVLPFDYAMLPDAFRGFVHDVAERMQCPPDYTAVAMMIVEAAIVGRKVAIRPKKNDDWLVVANLWGGIIGRPGVMKTPALQQAMKFLYRLEQNAKAEFENAMECFADDTMIAEIKEKRRRQAIEESVRNKRGDPKEAARRITIDKPIEPMRKRYIINDCTVEKLRGTARGQSQRPPGFPQRDLRLPSSALIAPAMRATAASTWKAGRARARSPTTASAAARWTSPRRRSAS